MCWSKATECHLIMYEGFLKPCIVQICYTRKKGCNKGISKGIGPMIKKKNKQNYCLNDTPDDQLITAELLLQSLSWLL